MIFWINLLKANKGDWASYVPGGFPDNVTSWKAVGPRTVRLQLNRSYNPIWFTNNELSQITPLPLAWDVTAIERTASRQHRSVEAGQHAGRGARRLPVPELRGEEPLGLRDQPDLVDRRRSLEARAADQLGAGDVRPQRKVRRSQQAETGEVRRAPIHE